jgi:hypothetical protein
MHTDIYASSGIQTHDPSVWTSEDSLCLRLHGHCDQPCVTYIQKMLLISSRTIIIAFTFPKLWNVSDFIFWAVSYIQ